MIIVPSAVRTTSGTATFDVPHLTTGAYYMLNVTNADTGATDTLNVYLQHSVDGGTTWADYISFSQFKGTDAAAKYAAQHVQIITPDVKHGAVTDGTLSAGTSNQGPIGSLRRAKWTIVDGGGGTQTFTFSVHAIFNQ